MFYPSITRREKYKSPYDNGKLYADYKVYYEEILVDCQCRCVYCDAKISENMGGDKMQLDHFRPQKHFPELECNPANLLLACPACNRFKSDHWPIGEKSQETYSNQEGFLDPFEVERLEFFQIDDEGRISSLQAPAKYLIKLLHLDRPARNILRRRRLLKKQVKKMLTQIAQKQRHLTDDFKKDTISKKEYLTKIEKSISMVDRLKECEWF